MTVSHLAATRVVGDVIIAPAMPGEVRAILDLIIAVHLPSEGIAEAMEYFWVARTGERIVGTVGLEVYNDMALLRSLAVFPAHQHTGLGRALTETALSYLTTRQFRAVYLLTTTAEAFFTRHGFCLVARDAVPASVQQSVEFQGVCPTTAACMARTFTYPASMPEAELQVRAARFADLPLIQDIHNQGIIDRVATLDTELRTMADTQLWFKRHGPRHPVLMAEAGGGIAGWASLNTFNVRPAYQYVADLSIYLARPWRGKGLGTRLLSPLLSLAGELGYHKIVLSSFPTNTAGMRLYTRQGFSTVGIYKEMGLLDGRWVDTILMEKLL